MEKQRKSKDLQVHIVDRHNEVVPYIHRAIASKVLPFTGIPVVHLDSHPDLLLAADLQADTVFNPQELYEELSIENWLLPLAFAKHVSHIVWVKPPWANQIDVGEQTFAIGKCAQTGKMRVTSKENYFLTDGLYCLHSKLCDPSDMRLTVVELKPDCWSEGDNKASLIKESENEENQAKNSQDVLFSSPEKWACLVQDIVKDVPYILDIDLDFFSTANPFKNMLQPEEEEAVRRLYHYSPLKDLSDQCVIEFSLMRQEKLNVLNRAFTSFSLKWGHSQKKKMATMDEVKNLSFKDLIGWSEKDLMLLSETDKQDLRTLCLSVLSLQDQREITFDQLHDFGCTLDDTELPHHISTESQVEALRTSLLTVLEKLPKPGLITIARSAEDDYCPQDKVDSYELMMLKMLESVFGTLQVNKDY